MLAPECLLSAENVKGFIFHSFAEDGIFVQVNSYITLQDGMPRLQIMFSYSQQSVGQEQGGLPIKSPCKQGSDTVIGIIRKSRHLWYALPDVAAVYL